MPRTDHPRSAAEAAVLEDELGYPVAVKPADPIEDKRRHRGGHSAARRGRSSRRRSPWPSRTSRWCRSSSPEATTPCTRSGAISTGPGKPLGVFSGRKLLQTPPLVGTCRVGEAVWVRRSWTRACLLAALDFRGLSQVEFKRDPSATAATS